MPDAMGVHNDCGRSSASGGNQGRGCPQAGPAIRIPQPAPFAQQSADHRAEVGRPHDAGHPPSQQFRNDHRPLHAIANGSENRRTGVGAQCDSKTAEEHSAQGATNTQSARVLQLKLKLCRVFVPRIECSCSSYRCFQIPYRNRDPLRFTTDAKQPGAFRTIVLVSCGK